MSDEDDVNDNLLERAREVAEYYTGTPLEEAILHNIKENNLDVVARLVKETDDYEQHEAYIEMRKDDAERRAYLEAQRDEY